MRRQSRDDLHERVGTLELVEELVELLQGELGVHSLTLVALIQQVHLQVDEALPVLLDVRVCGGDGEFEIEVDQLRVVDLFQKLGSRRGGTARLLYRLDGLDHTREGRGRDTAVPLQELVQLTAFTSFSLIN